MSGRPRRRWAGLISLLIVVLVGVGAWVALWHTSLFAVRTINVIGADDKLREQVLAAAQIPTGKPLVQVDIAGATTRIEHLGQVKHVQVQRDWPHAVNITVVVRQPVASTQANGRWWLLDATGLPYLSQPEQPAGVVPLKLTTPGPGDAATSAALSVAEAIGTLQPDIRGLVAAISAPSPYAITVELTDGRSVVWGDGGASRQKAATLPAVLAQPGTVFDISDPSFVTVK